MDEAIIKDNNLIKEPLFVTIINDRDNYESKKRLHSQYIENISEIEIDQVMSINHSNELLTPRKNKKSKSIVESSFTFIEEVDNVTQICTYDLFYHYSIGGKIVFPCKFSSKCNYIHYDCGPNNRGNGWKEMSKSEIFSRLADKLNGTQILNIIENDNSLKNESDLEDDYDDDELYEVKK